MALALCPAFALASESSDIDEAKATVDEYMIALSNGDTESILELLGGSFFWERAEALSNDQYPSLLQERYRTLRYDVNLEENANETVDDIFYFKVHLFFGNEDKMITLMTVRKEIDGDDVYFKIIDEQLVQ